MNHTFWEIGDILIDNLDNKAEVIDILEHKSLATGSVIYTYLLNYEGRVLNIEITQASTCFKKVQAPNLINKVKEFSNLLKQS